MKLSKANLPALGLITLSILFSVSYTQYPLFSSNQNTYFLPGFACANIGNLAHDWLANTQDATPLFSLLVCQTLKWFRWTGIFYLYYGLIQAIYFIAFYKLIAYQIKLTSLSHKILAITAIFVLHSAAIRYLLTHSLGPDWAYILEGGLANQRMLGSVFQPSVFGVFLLVSVLFALNQRNELAVLCLALAASFHPTYLLPSGLLILSYIFVLWLDKDQRKYPLDKPFIHRIFHLLFLYLLLILPILLYTLVHFAFVPPEVAEKAAAILVKVRIPHHADIHTWFNITSLVQLAILISSFFLTRRPALRAILIVPFLFGFLLTVIQFVTKSNQLALLFPWRISIVLIPLALSIWISWFIEILIPAIPLAKLSVSSYVKPLIPTLSLILISGVVIIGVIRFRLDLKRYNSAPEIPLYHYVHDHLSAEDVYLIPPKMENFRLSSGAAAYVDFKSSPYRADEVIEWYRRLSFSNQFYQKPTCNSIRLFEQENITHLVLPKFSSLHCPFLDQEFEDNFYYLYKLKNDFVK